MATTLYATAAASGLAIDPYNTPSARLLMSLSRGSGLSTSAASPTSAGTALFPYGHTDGTSTLNFISAPLSAVTISGQITINLWAAETNAMANIGAAAMVQTIRADGSAGSVVIGGSAYAQRFARGVEYGTTRSANNWSGTPASAVALEEGGRLWVQFQYADAGGTQASGYTSTMSYGATSGGVDGDTYVTFTETITASGGATEDPMPFIGGGYYG